MNTPSRKLRFCKRRAQRQEGAVLFLVLMIVLLVSLGATFAVEDTTATLFGSRAEVESLCARYAAESGTNATNSVVSGPSSAEWERRTERQAESGSLPNERLNVPPTTGAPYYYGTSRDTEVVAFNEGGTARRSLNCDSQSPKNVMYETVMDYTDAGNGQQHVTVSTYGRSSHGWDPDTGTFDADRDVQQTGRASLYHDTVSVARAFYLK